MKNQEVIVAGPKAHLAIALAQLVAEDAVMLASKAAEMMPDVEESVKRTYQKRPGRREEGIPDRVSVDPTSPWHTNCGAYLAVLLNEEPVKHCVEYCVSGGWVRIAVPSANGKVSASECNAARKTYGVVDVEWRGQPNRQVRRQLARMV